MAAIALAIALATGIAAAGPAHAATELRARASQATLDEGDTFDLLLRAAGDPPSAAPDLSVLAKDFDVVGTRQSQRLSVVNGRSEASVDWIVTLSPRSTGALTIPAIRAGDATSEPIAIDVRPASASPRATGGSGSQAGRGTAASPGASTAGAGAAANAPTAAGSAAPTGTPDLFVEATVDDSAPIVQGEVRYTVRVWDGVGIRDGAISEPSAENLRFTPVGDVETHEATRNGRRYRVHERDFTVVPDASGDLVIPPVTLQARVPRAQPQRAARSGRRAVDPFGSLDDLDDALADDPFDDAFGGFAGFPSAAELMERMMGGRQVRVRSNPVALHVKARPAEAAGEWFLPARSVELSQSWTPAKPTFRVGESITRTIALRALGSAAEQLPRFEIPAPAGVRQYPEGTRDGTLPSDDGTISVLEQSVSLVPTAPGRTTLPAVEVRWWDVAAEKMRTARLPEDTIDVLPAAGATTAAAPPERAPEQKSANPSSSKDDSKAVTTSATDSDPPTAAARPLSGAVVLGAAAAALLLAGGTLLAFRRRGAAAAPPTPDATSPASESPARLLSRVRTACETGDPRAARDAILTWGRVVWPDAPPRSTADVARRLSDGELARELAALDGRLYGRTDGAWDGRALARALAAARPGRSAMNAEPTANALPPLYPSDRSPERSRAA